MLILLLLISNWEGQSAKWIDDCTTSTSQTVTIYTATPIETAIKNYWTGGSSIDESNSGCT